MIRRMRWRACELAALLVLVAGVVRAGLVWEREDVVVPLAKGETVARARFGFRNAGDRVVVISQLRPGCHCLTATAAVTQVAPGGSGQVDVAVDTTGREGRMTRDLLVYTDDQPDRPTGLRVTVEIPEPVALETKLVTWALNAEPTTRSLVVTVAEPGVARVDAVRTVGDAFAAVLVESETRGRYRLELTPRSTAEPLQSAIRVEASVAGQKRVFIVYAVVK